MPEPIARRLSRIETNDTYRRSRLVQTRSGMVNRSYRLIGPDGLEFQSPIKGTLGGHRRSKIYGRLDCPGAARAIARGGPYPRFRVFFADEATAIAAGYRPCAVCLPEQYGEWRRR